MKIKLTPNEQEMLDKIRDASEKFYQMFVNAPASSQYHGVYRGGLLKHSCNVTRAMKRWVEKHPNGPLTIDDCLVIGMYHDLCKFDNYIKQADGSYKAAPGAWRHHAARSVEIIEKLHLVELTRLQRVCILLHMSGWENEEDWAALSEEDMKWLGTKEGIIAKTVVNWADMDASKQEAVEEATPKRYKRFGNR